MGKVLLWLCLSALTVSTVFSRFAGKASKRQGYYGGCPDGQYQCMDGSGCAEYCNGVSDCTDNEDEKWCGCPDPMNEVHCGDGINCYKYDQYCDGNQDCSDGSDEHWCGCPNTDESHCNDGIECYRNDQYCDGSRDCGDGSDEKWCGCPNQEDWYCNDGITCYSPGQYCDGTTDCPDGSDEQYCYSTPSYGGYSSTPSYGGYSSSPSYGGVGSNCGYGSVKECINGRCVDVNDICTGYDSCSSLENEFFCQDYYNYYNYSKKMVAARNLNRAVDDKMLKVKAFEVTRNRHSNENKARNSQAIRQNAIKKEVAAKKVQKLRARKVQLKSDNLSYLIKALRNKIAARNLHNKK